MSIDIIGTTLVNNSGLDINYGGVTIQKITTAGSVKRYTTGQPMFSASHTTNGWTAFTASVWQVHPFNTTASNYQSCFNTTTSRFTAPIAGIYLFTASSYLMSSSAGGYAHSMFWVNGSAGLRRPGSGTYLHRLKAHGIAAGYSFDAEGCEIIQLSAGDYVEFYVTSANVVNFFGTYSHFAGVLIS